MQLQARWRGRKARVEFQQNKAPKVAAADLSPVSWPDSPPMEWCPPGHGDLYPALLGSGTLDKLLKDGFKCARRSRARRAPPTPGQHSVCTVHHRFNALSLVCTVHCT